MPYKDPEIAKKKAAERYLAKREERRAKQKAYYEENKDKIIAKSKEYVEANRDKVLEYQKQWKKENPEKFRDSKRQSYLKNREKYIEKMVQYNRDNREEFHKRLRKYRSTEKGQIARRASRNSRRKREEDASLGRRWKNEVYDVYKQCAQLRQLGHDVEVDHIVPLLGKNVSGLHVPWNLAIIPAKENRTKTNKFVDCEVS